MLRKMLWQGSLFLHILILFHSYMRGCFRNLKNWKIVNNVPCQNLRHVENKPCKVLATERAQVTSPSVRYNHVHVAITLILNCQCLQNNFFDCLE